MWNWGWVPPLFTKAGYINNENFMIGSGVGGAVKVLVESGRKRKQFA